MWWSCLITKVLRVNKVDSENPGHSMGITDEANLCSFP